jgi:hypothetical protein
LLTLYYAISFKKSRTLFDFTKKNTAHRSATCRVNNGVMMYAPVLGQYQQMPMLID